MGITFVEITVRSSPGAEPFQQIECLVDTGAHLTVLPAATLSALGIQPERVEDFFLADGSKIQRKVGNIYVEYEGRAAYTQAVFGEPDDAPLLGMLTIEELHFWIDPLKRKLHPLKLRM
jgi:predicted aspartyl protease